MVPVTTAVGDGLQPDVCRETRVSSAMDGPTLNDRETRGTGSSLSPSLIRNVVSSPLSILLHSKKNDSIQPVKKVLV